MSRRLALLLATMMALAGCGSSARPGISARQFRNPVIAGDFPDPYILKVGPTYYAYATTNAAQNLQIARSTDLVHWKHLSDPLPQLPAWQSIVKGYTWAPAVVQLSDRFVMYYVGRQAQIDRQCISVAVASDPAGPFTDSSSAPAVCPSDLGGSIDPEPFADLDGTPYLLWKSDGNCCGLPTEIWIQRLSADGLFLDGQPQSLGIRQDAAWEGNLIEAPTLIHHDQSYYLFYSANGYDGPNYAVGYATSQSLLGPYTKASENPILTSKSPAAGPGGQAIIEGPQGGLWMVYQAWDAARVGYGKQGVRSMWIDRLTFEHGKPVVHGPTAGAQTLP
jgi:beta-xylosidase